MVINKNIKCIVFSLLALTGASCWSAATDPNEDLLEAINRGDVDRAARALRNGADPNRENPHGMLPLTLTLLSNATWENPLPMMQLLIENGADVNRTNRYGATALYNAGNQRPRSREIIQLLLDQGALVNIQESLTDSTPLMMIALYDNAEAARALLDAGANKELLDHQGRTALDFARRSNSSKVIAVLQNWAPAAAPAPRPMPMGERPAPRYEPTAPAPTPMEETLPSYTPMAPPPPYAALRRYQIGDFVVVTVEGAPRFGKVASYAEDTWGAQRRIYTINIGGNETRNFLEDQITPA